MKSHLLLLFALALGLSSPNRLAKAASASGTSAEPGALVARLHHLGVDHLGPDSSGTVFREIWRLPATVQFRDDTLDKLGTAISSAFQAKGQGANGNCARLIRPLLTDLVTAESIFEVLEPVPGKLDWSFGARLDDARAHVWEENLSQLRANWQPRRGALSFTNRNGWTAVRISADATEPARGSVYDQLQQGQRPGPANPDYWLRLEGDMAKWRPWLAHLGSKDLPQIDLTVTGKKEYLRTQAKLSFREPIRARSAKWEIPTETIRDPLISFTAVQGIASWLERQSWMKELGLPSAPDQLYLWGLSQTAFQIQAATPVTDASRAFKAIAERWVPKWNRILATNAVGQFRSLTNRTELAWRGLPIIVPYINPGQDHGRDYLRAGIFPVNPPTNPPPAALFEQLTGQTNLLYYDWEITQARLDQLRPLLQVAAVFLTVSPMSTNSSAYRWLDVAAPRLGNAATEVAMISPRELTLVRTSHLGFNGAELLSLANWLEGTNFPRVNLDLHFRPVARSKRQPTPR